MLGTMDRVYRMDKKNGMDRMGNNYFLASFVVDMGHKLECIGLVE